MNKKLRNSLIKDYKKYRHLGITRKQLKKWHKISVKTWPLRSALNEVYDEYKTAAKNHDKFNSAHEGYGIILEELDELWDWVKKKEKNRSKKEMRGEAKQIAAMALRFMVDLT